MFYLHKILLSTRSSVICWDENPTAPTTYTYLNGEPISDYPGTGGNTPNKNQWTLGPIETANEAKRLAITLAQHYCCDILKDGKPLGLPVMGEPGKWVSPSDAAAALGQLGGRSTSKPKTAASRANGRKGGRPRTAGKEAK